MGRNKILCPFVGGIAAFSQRNRQVKINYPRLLYQYRSFKRVIGYPIANQMQFAAGKEADRCAGLSRGEAQKISSWG